MIKFIDVTKHYNQRPVLSDITLNIDKGQTVVLIGLSGCGKTTTLKMINRLIRPDSGQIFIRDKDITEWDEIKLRRRIGYVIQQTGLFPHMTVRENIEIILRLEKNSPEFIAARTKELLDLVSLDENLLGKYPNELSGGQQQRVGVARAFSTDPEIILMDEPFSALDPITKGDLQDSFVELQEKLHKTIVFVTHDMNEALKIADKICIMDAGKIIQYDTPENILKNPCNDFVAEFIGKNRIWESPELIKVKDIMIEHPIVCSPKLTLTRCRDKMRTYGIDSLIVVEEHSRKFLGVLYARLIRAAADKLQAAEAVMKTKIATVDPSDSIVDVLEIVKEKNRTNIPVVDKNGILVGLITKSSLITTLSEQYFDTDTED